MTFLPALFAALLGAIFGSFLNALSFRYRTGISVLRGRSRCMRCAHALAWHDLVPLVSFAALRGRCRYCRTRIALQYPLVELSAMLLSLGVFLLHPEPLSYLLYTAIWMVALFLVAYDARHAIIPWSGSILLALLSLASLFLSGVPAAWALAAGPLLALPLFLLWAVSGGRWMGLGDSAFELSLGWLLGATAGFTALMLAVWSGALVGSALLALSKRVTIRSADASYSRRSLGNALGNALLSLHLTMKSEIPFAPFLAFGAVLAYFFHVDFFATLPLLW